MSGRVVGIEQGGYMEAAVRGGVYTLYVSIRLRLRGRGNRRWSEMLSQCLPDLEIDTVLPCWV